ncbi:ABC transporter family substrate-binding protein [Arthrobacter castelli]|uniref:ABC transporter family substrate-binding protein n=1 Tax=Arthrobacter castelli TaxID=271431 RepID=UPI000411324A|nr:ABC transporter family substrate-binding protein [Arthrobacter castelli]
MKITRRIVGVVMASALALTGCSGGEATNTGPTGEAIKEQPPDGVPASYQGKLPMPEAGEAYNNPTDREDIRDGGELRLAIGDLGPQFNVNHVAGNTVYTGTLMNYLAPQPWMLTVDGKPSLNEDYLLSAEVTSEEPMVVEYEINPNAVWNDGTPIDWTAFEATWTAMNGENEKFQPYSTDGYSNIESVEQGETPKHVVVTFETPFYPFESLFSNSRLLHPDNADPKVFNEAWVEEIPTDMLSGPYIVKNYNKTSETITLVPNPNWWGDPPKLDRITFTVMDPSASINAFVNGELDSTSVATADRLEQVQGMDPGEAMIRRGINTNTNVYVLRKKDEGFFADDAARKAVFLGTNRQQLSEIEFRGLDWEEEPPGSVLMRPFQAGYEDNIADLHFDPKAAKQTLEEAGWVEGEDGIRTKEGERATFDLVNFGDSALTAALARAQQQMMKEIGIDMVIDNRPGTEFSTTLSEGRYDMLSMYWAFGGAPFGYADSACQLYCSDSASNYPGVGNEELDKELKAISTIKDPEKAKAAANEAESEALHLFGTFPRSTGPLMTAVRTGLANWGPAGFLTVPAEDIGWEKES